MKDVDAFRVIGMEAIHALGIPKDKQKDSRRSYRQKKGALRDCGQELHI